MLSAAKTLSISEHKATDPHAQLLTFPYLKLKPVNMQAARRLVLQTEIAGVDGGHSSQPIVGHHRHGLSQAPDVHIHVGGTTFAADSAMLRMFSTCARGMPELFTEWDLDTFTVFDGAPPLPDVVAAWLEAVYWSEDAPHTPKTLQEVVPVLRFADAVGSPAAFMNALVDRITSSWALHITGIIGSSFMMPITATGPLYVALYAKYEQCTICSVPDGTTTDTTYLEGLAPYPASPLRKHFTVGTCNPSSANVMKKAAIKEAATQLEQLLFLAHSLKLDRLAQALHAFIHLQLLVGKNGFFYKTEKLILSKRVLSSLDQKPAAEGWVRWITGDDNAVSQLGDL